MTSTIEQAVNNPAALRILTILQSVNGASFISMDTTTIPLLKGGKKNPMKDRVRKHNKRANIMVFQNNAGTNGYDNMVKRRLIKEGRNPESFELSPRKWGKRWTGTPIVEHKGELYLEVIYLTSGKSSYTLEGQPIAKDDIEGLNDSKPEGEQGGLYNKVIIRTFKLSSIDRLAIGDKVYTRKELLG